MRKGSITIGIESLLKLKITLVILSCFLLICSILIFDTPVKIIENYIRQRVQQILSCLTAEERAKLLVLIGKVVSTLKEMAG